MTLDYQTAISISEMSKCYRIGSKEMTSESLATAIVRFLKSPITNYRKYRSLYRFDDMDPLNDENSTNPSDIIWALRNVSLDIKKGEVIGVIGRNGAGKSTLLKILSRITPPTRGGVRIRGRVSSLLEVGTGFHPELTGRENIYLNGTILGMKKKELDAKYESIVEFSGVETFIDTPVKRYSSGMSVRLAFSVAAHLDPDILVVDEVLAVGDAEFQKKCLNKMGDVARMGRTVLFVSHNMPAVTRLCERAVLLDNGGVIADGPAHETVRTYLNSEKGTLAAREWKEPATAPQGDVARLRAVRLQAENGTVSDTIEICRSMSVEMEFDVLRSGYILLPFFHFYNDDGVLIFCAHDTDPIWEGLPRPTGRYKSKVWIPGNYLNEGEILVNAGLSTLDPIIVQANERDVVGFQVVERNGTSPARGGYAGNMGGVVRPLFKWETDYVEEFNEPELMVLEEARPASGNDYAERRR